MDLHNNLFTLRSTNSGSSAGLVLITIGTIIGLSILGALTFLVIKRKEMQPLKIKSPQLLSIFLIGNIVTIIFLFFVSVNVEVYYMNGSDASNSNNGLKKLSETCGYLLVCLSEPLLLLSFLLRFVRIRKIFDAQQIYFEHGVRPSEMI